MTRTTVEPWMRRIHGAEHSLVFSASAVIRQFGSQVNWDEVRRRARAEIEERLTERPESQFALDHSDMSVSMAAAVLAGAAEASAKGPVSLACFGRPASNSGPPFSSDFVSPISGQFSGWSTDYDRPMCAIIGPCRPDSETSSIVDALRPSQVWRFTSRIGRESGPGSTAWFTYDADQPFQTFIALDTLCEKLAEQNSVVIVPLSMGTFGTCCLAIALGRPEISVWTGPGQHLVQPESLSGEVGLQLTLTYQG